MDQLSPSILTVPSWASAFPAVAGGLEMSQGRKGSPLPFCSPNR